MVLSKENHSHSHNHNHNHASSSHSHLHHNHHGHSHKEKKFLGCCVCSDVLRLSFMIFLVFSFFLVELIVGYLTRSIALTNDAFHMFSDSMALIIALVTAIISRKKHIDLKKRTEVLGSLINSVFLISLCFRILIEAIERLIDPKPIKDINLLLYVGITGLIINLAGLFLFGHGHGHTHSHDKEYEREEKKSSGEEDLIEQIKINTAKSDFILSVKEISSLKEKVNNKNDQADLTLLECTSSLSESGVNNLKKKKKKTNCHILSKEANMNMRAAFLHVLADALGSVVVIVSALINKYQKELYIPEKMVDLIDPMLCICLVILILSSTVPLAKQSTLFLLKSKTDENVSGCTKKESNSSITNSNVILNKLSARRHSIV